ncbi:rod shape-determining protein MreD [Haloactinospora alba]|uniref:Rod shape-determining protein MreD n=1 Tax=Haloactinospora alba TaxID=405555 RepID=A0A543NKL4_9ACTN|nr:rod shape-determining protein MreD [Haloactinospora alba]TQN32354.1 rod shape-determining protein MreD [Haloactinospora alba]
MNRLVAALLVAGAVVLQVAVVNRLPLPWGVPPDVVVLVLTAVALGTTPVTGALSGFAAGLAVDVLPPADHELGRYALLLSVAGYAVGSLRQSRNRGAAWPFIVAAGTVFGVALGWVLISVLVGDPRATLSSAVVTVALTTGTTMLVSPLVLLPALKLRNHFTTDDVLNVAVSPRVGGIRG